MGRLKRFLALSVVMFVPFFLNWVYYQISRHEVAALWQFEPNALLLYTGPPEARYMATLERITARAHALGFRFHRPRLLQTNHVYDLWYERWQWSGYGAVSVGGNAMLVDGVWLADFSDEDLECMVGHELGHVIDAQTNRIGIPMTYQVRCLPPQEFADAVGRVLCGVEHYNAMMRRYKIYRPQVSSECVSFAPVR